MTPLCIHRGFPFTFLDVFPKQTKKDLETKYDIKCLVLIAENIYTHTLPLRIFYINKQFKTNLSRT